MSFIRRIDEAYRTTQLDDAELNYSTRHVLLPDIGSIGQRKLKASRVLVIGAGGLGCSVLQGLCGAGVGYMTVVDGDSVSVSNLSRQWLHNYSTVENNKALSAKAALLVQNPRVCVDAKPVFFDKSNGAALIASHDLVVDATDVFEARILIDELCAQFDRPWIHGALYRQSGQVSAFWERCGARFMQLHPESVGAPSCSGAGVLGSVASVVGHCQALEAIKLIVGYGRPAIGRVITFDAVTLRTAEFWLGGVKEPELCGDNSQPGNRSFSLSVEQARQFESTGERIDWIDIRSINTAKENPFAGAFQYSVDELLGSRDWLKALKKPVLICEEGIVSRLIVEASRCGTSSDVRYLDGGYQAWVNVPCGRKL